MSSNKQQTSRVATSSIFVILFCARSTDCCSMHLYMKLYGFEFSAIAPLKANLTWYGFEF